MPEETVESPDAATEAASSARKYTATFTGTPFAMIDCAFQPGMSYFPHRE
jgi:hypothetical protein